MSSQRRSYVTALLSLALMTARAHGAVADETVSYARDVVPLLRTYCLGCHSRVESGGGLSMQSADDLQKGSDQGPVIDAADPASSKLAVVLMSSGDDHMPPADQPQPAEAELAVLLRWIRAGAPIDSREAVLPPLPDVPVTAAHVPIPARAMQLAASGRLLIGRDREVELRDAASNQVLWSVEIPDGKVTDVRFSADEQRILAATGVAGLSGRALEFGIGDTVPAREFAGHGDMLFAAVWSPDETVVATAGYDRTIVLHDARTGARLREFSGHNGAVFDLAFSPDGQLLASASADATIKVWRVATGERLDTLGQPQGEQYSVVFSPDGRFIYGAGTDSRIRQWQVVSRDTAAINPLLISRFAHEGVISEMEISCDGRFLVSASESGVVKVWDAVQVRELSAVRVPPQTVVTSLAIDPAGHEFRVALSSGATQLVELPDVTESAETAASPLLTATPLTTVPLNEPVVVAETEPNTEVASAQPVPFPATIQGLIHSDISGTVDRDVFRFSAIRGQPVLLEVKAARDGSRLDSLLEVLTVDGQPVLQAQLQAVRDSYFTFRGKDSDSSDDFRLFNWQEMELNEYLYADGEVVRLWLYPRGPDSGFKVYPGFGLRETWFGTTPTSHPLQGPAFIVVPYGPDARLRDTGLPVFPVYFENDDDSMRQWGRDSRVLFLPPDDGDYLARISDARGEQGADFVYQLLIRPPRPDFSLDVSGTEIRIHRGTGRELGFTATRLDGFTGPIEIFAENLPPGFTLSDPILIQDEQRQAFATLIAAPEAVQPSDEAVAAVKLKARAMIGEREVVHEIGGLKSLKIADNPKISVTIQTPDLYAAGSSDHAAEIITYAGETTRAFLRVRRHDHSGLVEFGKEDAGRNLPHGVFVDNIGLNGLMLLENQNEREFFITVAPWVPESSRPFHLKSTVEDITSFPVMLHVRRRSPN